MPIGAAKLGVLGAGLVPGGSVTFNASGTWPIPPGVKKVSITGKGGTGNPGVAGNPGNPGNPGTGGGGGGGGRMPGPGPVNCGSGSCGRGAWSGSCGSFQTNFVFGGIGGGSGNTPQPLTIPGDAGQSGVSGSGGSAGNAGSAGSTGQSSSGLGNNFAGGAGGNAPVGGTAGNAGSGGPGGGGGEGVPLGPSGNGGSAGTGGGSGGPAHTKPTPQGTRAFSGAGGGGAGATNDGTPGGAPGPGSVLAEPQFYVGSFGGRGGTTANYSVLTNPLGFGRAGRSYPCPGSAYPTNITGGVGGFGSLAGLNNPVNGRGTVGAFSIGRRPAQDSDMDLRNEQNQPGNAVFSPYPVNSPAFPAIRSGGGGGGGGKSPNSQLCAQAGGGGGGGGGRGNAGNAGGNSPTVSGSAATPATFNCVPVSPGTTTPITVGSPGGQIVISWNPQ